MQNFQRAATVLAHRLPYSAKPHSRILPQRGREMEIAVFYHHLREAAREQQLTEEESLAWARSLGIRFVELDGSEFPDDREAERLAGLLRAADLGVSSIYMTYDWQARPEDLKQLRQIRVGQIFGARHIMPIPGFYTEEQTAQEERTDGQQGLPDRQLELQNMIRGMESLCAEAEKAGIDVTMEDFDNARSPIRNMDGMDAFLEAVPALSVTLDTGNFRYSAEDALAAFHHFEEKFPGRVRHVHCKDRLIPDGAVDAGVQQEVGRTRQGERGSLRKSGEERQVQSESAALRQLYGEPLIAMDGAAMYPCAVGKGSMPIPQILAELAAKGYDGILSMEFFGAASYTDCIRESAAFLRKYAAGV